MESERMSDVDEVNGYRLRAAVAKALGWTEHIMRPGVFIDGKGSQVHGWLPHLRFDDALRALDSSAKTWPKQWVYQFIRCEEFSLFKVVVDPRAATEKCLASGVGKTLALAICRALVALAEREEAESFLLAIAEKDKA